MNGLFIQKYVFVQQNIIFQCFVTKDYQYHLCYKQKILCYKREQVNELETTDHHDEDI